MSEGMPGRKKRTLENGLVYEAPKTRKVTGDELNVGDRLAENGTRVNQKMAHGSDEVLVLLDGGGSRIFSKTEPEIEIFEEE